ncbi:hypothetical protein FLL79_10960 [Vibrio cholerae]|nr:hypothetical protein FLL79_10960 [Vibrio cholerae]
MIQVIFSVLSDKPSAYSRNAEVYGAKSTILTAHKATNQTLSQTVNRDSSLPFALNMVLSTPILSLVYNAA